MFSTISTFLNVEKLFFKMLQADLKTEKRDLPIDKIGVFAFRNLTKSRIYRLFSSYELRTSGASKPTKDI